jgi:hypothetical protein
MDIEYTATSGASTTEPYQCSKCDYVGKGHASALASATVAQGGVVFGNDRADEMARDEADAVAWQEAMSDVPMAPCPRCGAVSSSAWIGWLTKPRILMNLVIGVFTFGAGLLFLTVAFTSAGNVLSMVCAGVGGLLLAVGGPGLAARIVMTKRAATRRVRFDPPR